MLERQADRRSPESPVVPPRHPVPHLDHPVQFCELDQPDGGLKVGHLEIKGDNVAVIPVRPRPAAINAFVIKLLVVGKYGAAVAGRQDFGGVEAGDGYPPETAGGFIPEVSPGSLGKVLDQGQPVFFNVMLHLFHIGRMPVGMSYDNGVGGVEMLQGHGRRVKVMGFPVNIGKNHGGAGVDNGVQHGIAGQGRNDDAFYPQRPDGQVESRRAGAHGGAVAPLEFTRQSRFQLPHGVSHRQPPAFDDPDDGFLFFLAEKRPGQRDVHATSSLVLIIFAGTPTTVTLSGISLITTAPAPTITFLPIVQRGITLAPVPIMVFFLTVT